jgi:CHAT domain-containing protein/tetratricopeptide (TPR) repeat protein
MESREYLRNAISKIEGNLRERNFQQLLELIAFYSVRYEDAAMDLAEPLIEKADLFDLLGYGFMAMREFGEAQHYYERSLKIRTILFGEVSTPVVRSYRRLAFLFEETQNSKDGNEYKEKAHKGLILLQEKLNTQLSRYHKEGNYWEAIKVGRELCDVEYTLSGDKSLDYAQVLSNLAFLNKTVAFEYEQPEFYRDAEILYEKAYQIVLDLSSAKQEILGVLLINMGEMFRITGQYQKAEIFQLKALQFWLDTKGEGSEQVGGCYNNLGMLYQDLKQPKKAEDFYLKAIAARRRLLGENHELFAQSLNNIAKFYSDQGRDAEVESLLLQAKDILERKLGASHPACMKALSNLAEHYEKIGKKENIDPMFEDFLKSLETASAHKALDLTELPELTAVFKDLAIGLRKEKYAAHSSTDFLDAKIESFTDAAFQFELANCLKDFRRGRYADCFRDAVALNSKCSTFEVLQIYLISVQLLNGPILPGKAGGMSALLPLLNLVTTRGWPYRLLQLSVGDLSFEKAKTYAEGEKQIYQTHCYAGFRMLAEGRKDEAQKHFSICLNMPLSAFESSLIDPNILRYEINKDHGSPLKKLNSQLAQYLRERKVNEALETGSRAYQYALANCSSSSREYQLTLTNLASAYFLAGNLARAKEFFEQTLALVNSSKDKDDDISPLVNNGLGLVNLNLGNFTDAEQRLKESIDYFEKRNLYHDPNFGQALGNLAEVYRERGDFQLAIPLYEKAIGVMAISVGKEDSEYARWIHNFGLLYLQNSDYDMAETCFRRALGIREKALPAQHMEIGRSFSALAQIEIQKRQYATARRKVLKSLVIEEKNLGPKNINYAFGLATLSAICMYERDFDQAQGLLGKAQSICNEILPPDHTYFETINKNMACVYILKGQYEVAFDIIEKTFEINGINLDKLFSRCSERQQLILLNQLFSTQALLFSVLLKLSELGGFTERAYSLVLQRKNTTAESYIEKRLAVSQMKGEGKSTFDRILDLRMKIARKSLAGPGLAGGTHHQNLIDKWVLEKDKLEATLAAEFPAVKNLQSLSYLNGQTIAQALPAGSALIEFVYFQYLNLIDLSVDDPKSSGHYIGFLVLPDGEKKLQLFDLGNAIEIEGGIAKFIGAIFQEQRDGDFDSYEAGGTHEWGDLLGKKLFSPFEPYLQNCQRLYIVPDAKINLLSFAVLKCGNAYLIDRYEITYLNSGRDILSFQTSSKKDQTSVVVANPNFDLNMRESDETRSLPSENDAAGNRELADRAKHLDRITDSTARGGPRFNSLEGTRFEGESVASMINAILLSGDDALESRLKACVSPYILHIATHGFFLPFNQDRSIGPSFVDGQEPIFTKLENPLLRAGLALAGANAFFENRRLPAEAEDGILTAEDVLGLNLINTEMVVLSACETALGDLSTGEGVFGLRRAFSMAGAKSLIMSHWKVPDLQTKDLMIEFYKNLCSGMSKAAALRRAQLTIKASFRHPYYWGAFICQGNPNSIDGLVTDVADLCTFKIFT